MLSPNCIIKYVLLPNKNETLEKKNVMIKQNWLNYGWDIFVNRKNIQNKQDNWNNSQ